MRKTHKRCNGPCGRILPLSEYGRCNSVDDGRRARCKSCVNAWDRANPRHQHTKVRKVVIRDAAHYKAGRDRYNANTRARRHAVRAEALRILGGECTTCGTTNTGVLHIHHKDGLGAEHRRRIGRGAEIFQWVCAVSKTEHQRWGVTLLCASCHSRVCDRYPVGQRRRHA